MLLNEVDAPGSDVEEYISSLDAILAHKMELISVLRSRMAGFYKHIKEEEKISKQFYESQNKIDEDNEW